MNEQEKDVIELSKTYNDGSMETVSKGFLCTMVDDEEGTGFTFDMCNISGEDLAAIVYGVLELGDRLGLFNNLEAQP